MVYFASRFDPITQDEIKVIEFLKKQYQELGLLLIEKNGREGYENRVKIIEKICPGFIILNSDKINKDETIFTLDEFEDLSQYQILTKEFLNKNNIKLDNISSDDIIYLNNYNLVHKDIRDFINYNLLYIRERLFVLMDLKRLEHSLNVGQAAYDLATDINYNDPKKARFAGTLHDIAKRFSVEKTERYIKSIKMDKILKEPWQIHHGFAGGGYLKNNWLVNDKEIFDSIIYHTVGRENMTVLDKIVFCADKISSDRDYDGVEKYRAQCFSNFEEGFKSLLKNQYQQACIKNGKDSIGKLLIKTYNFYFDKEL
ncbi:bis(5'-nucleosyl)-tetraphosphatase (symmetrical) YqeK [Spiroplasma endosymbiont of Aspidapion aeneum]|uniref:bis(5'-nucleosyl)-tetraphosphatase (symmetrical) YqeK n=1 Tax=Spiroplasma endosymbiont of Aspidapion aeneum TaxID=3066276 RepID=UPI00313B9FF8